MLLRSVLIFSALSPLFLTAQTVSSSSRAPAAPETQTRPEKLSLRAAVDKALLNNLNIAVSRLVSENVGETVEIAKSEFDFTLSAASEWRRALPPGVEDYAVTRNLSDVWDNSVGIAKKFSTGGTVAVGTGVGTSWLNNNAAFSPDNEIYFSIEGKQPLLAGAGSTVNLAPIVKARQNFEKSKLDLRKTVLDLLRDTEIAYWRLSAMHALLALRESSLESAEQLLKQAKKMRELGAAIRLDELQAESDIAAQRVAIINAKQSISDAEDNLRLILSGMNRVELPEIEVSLLPENTPKAPPAFARWIPDVRAFDIDAHIRAIDIEQAQLDLLVADNADNASLDLVGGASVYGRDGNIGEAYGGAFNRPGYALNAGIRLTLPLGFRETEARLRQAVRTREQARLRAGISQQQTMFDARTAWRALNTARDRLAATRATVALKRETFIGQQAKNANGDATMSDVLIAKASLDAAELENLQALLDCLVADARVQRLDGKILAKLGFSWDAVDNRAGTEPNIRAENQSEQ